MLEREDTRADYGEPRFRAIGEGLQDILVVIYAHRDTTCRMITAWEAESWKLEL